MKGPVLQGDTHSGARFPALTGDTRALVGFTVTEKESLVFSIPAYRRLPMLQPDDSCSEIQISSEKLTEELENRDEYAEKTYNFLDTCSSPNTASFLTENISLQHALNDFFFNGSL